MLTLATLFCLAAPSANFKLTRDSVTIDKAVWYDADGQRHVTDAPCLQIRMTVTNQSDHPIRWPGFSQARVKYSERTGNLLVGGTVLLAKLGPGCRWDNSLVTDQVVAAGQRTTILVVFDLPRSRGHAGLTLQWPGETKGVWITVKQGFQLPVGNEPVR
jgi:hypothetical protein